MTSDRAADRHTTGRHIVSIPDEKWTALGERVGNGKRSETIRDLIDRFLAGKPMPRRPRNGSGPVPNVKDAGRGR